MTNIECIANVRVQRVYNVVHSLTSSWEVNIMPADIVWKWPLGTHSAQKESFETEWQPE